MRNRRIEIPQCQDCKSKGDSLFCSLHHEELYEFSSQKSHILYKAGQIIFFEGNYPQGLYCIHKGKVKVYKMGEEGKEQIVRFAKDSDVLGYRALLADEAYYASASALEDTLICFFPKQHFMEALRKNPKMSLDTIKVLAENLKFAEQRTVNMAQNNVRERVAEALILIQECYGFEEDGKTINTRMTRREIGSVAGTTTETTIRVISDFNKEKLLKIDGKKLILLDIPELERVANNSF